MILVVAVVVEIPVSVTISSRHLRTSRFSNYVATFAREAKPNTTTRRRTKKTNRRQRRTQRNAQGDRRRQQHAQDEKKYKDRREAKEEANKTATKTTKHTGRKKKKTKQWKQPLYKSQHLYMFLCFRFCFLLHSRRARLA